MTSPKFTLATDRATIEPTLNRRISTLTTERAKLKDSLALGLCCCDRSPRLVALVVKYFSHCVGLEFVSDYHWMKPILDFSDNEPYCEDKREIVKLMTVFPIKN